MGATIAFIAVVALLIGIRVLLVLLSRPKPKYDFQRSKPNEPEDDAIVIRIEPTDPPETKP